MENAATFEHPTSGEGFEVNTLRYFIENCDIKIKQLDDEEIIFDITGIDAPLANALRRILIAEIPTMAIEKVNLYQNTSIIPDENLAHRMGLIPILADAAEFEYRKPGEDATEKNSIVFKLHATCTKQDLEAEVPLNCSWAEEERIFNNANVMSGNMQLQLFSGQEQNEKSPKPLLDDILVAKMRPGQEIEMVLICEKGLGKTHAKWSPVCTAFYRLLPDIRLTQPVLGADAEELKATCRMGVFDIEDLGKSK